MRLLIHSKRAGNILCLKRIFSDSPITFILPTLVAMLWLLHGCTSPQGYTAHPELLGGSESGAASHYSQKFQWRKTASGESLDNHAMTAAHKTLPFGTKLRVTNRENGRSVIVVINDRGPFVQGRIIDLTRAAFAKIGNVAKGVLEVKIKVVL